MTFMHCDTSPFDVCHGFRTKTEPFQLHILVCSVPLCGWRHPEASSTWGSASALRVVTVPKRNRPLKDKHDYSESRYLFLMWVCASVWPPLDKVHPEGKTDALFGQTFPWLISPLQSLFCFLTGVTLCKQIACVTLKPFNRHYCTYMCTINTINRCGIGTNKHSADNKKTVRIGFKPIIRFLVLLINWLRNQKYASWILCLLCAFFPC